LSNLVYNSIWSLASRIFNIIVKAFAVIFLARILGPSEFGVFTLVISTVALLAVFVDLGISPASARLLAEDNYNNRNVVLSSSRMIFLIFILFSGLLFYFGDDLFTLINAEVLSDFKLLFILLIFVQIVQQFLKKCFEGLKRVDLSSKVSLSLDWAPWGLAILFVILFTTTAKYAVIGKVIGTSLLVIGFMILSVYVLNKYRAHNIEKRASYGMIFTYALPMLVTAISFYIYTHSDILIIQGFLGETDVGIYGVAVRLLDTLHVPAAAVGSAVAAFFVTVRNKEPEKIQNLFYDTTKWTLFLFFPLSIGLAVTATELFPFLFGDEYAYAAIIAIIYTPTLLFKSLSATYSLALDYMGYARKRAVAISISAAFNIGLNFIMIPRYGIVGAAITTQITYLPLVIWYTILMQRLTFTTTKSLTERVLPILISGAVMGIVILLVKQFMDIHILTVILIGVIAYFFICGITGGIKKSDIKNMLTKLKK